MRLFWMKIKAIAARFVHVLNEIGWFSWYLVMLSVLLVMVVSNDLSPMDWDWLSTEESNGTTVRKSGSEIVRNLGLVIAAIIAMPLAIWRSTVAERQAIASQRQAETAQRSLLNERYQKGAEMLGSAMLPVRLGGIYALARLAREHPEEYHTQIMELFCAFVRIPIERDEKSATTDREEQATSLREDVQAILTAIGKRSETQIKTETEGTGAPYILNLSGANLTGANLVGAVLSRASLSGVKLSHATLFGAKLAGAVLSRADLADANLTGADLSHASLNGVKLANAKLSKADLTGAHLDEADLSYAKLLRANLTDAILISANLTHTNLSGCTGLTQDQLNDAVAHNTGPPTLTDAVDAKIGIPLVWHRNHV